MVRLTGELDLVRYPERTRSMLLAVEREVGANTTGTVFVDLSGATWIDPASVLYLLAVIRDGNTHDRRIRGNTPRNRDSARMIRESGFLECIDSRMRTPRSKEMLRVKFGSSSDSVSPDAWMEIHDFLTDSGELPDELVDVVYAALSECIENVIQHAYTYEEPGRWYCMGVRGSAHRPTRMVILDRGVGISESVRRRIGDWVIASTYYLLASTAKTSLDFEYWSRLAEWQFVRLAAEGLRTQTNQPGRGTGLSSLRASAVKHEKMTLSIMSNSATISWSVQAQEPVQVVGDSIQGTIVCFEFRHVNSQHPT